MSNLTPTRATPSDRYLRWIAGFNLAKGVLFLGLAFLILKFLHKDVDEIVGRWISALQLDLENEHIAALLERLNLVTDRQIKQLSGVAFVLAGLFFTEGAGLLLRQQWAKYLTIIVSSSFIPLELIEVMRKFGLTTLGLLVSNTLIVCLLIANLRREAGPSRQKNTTVGAAPAISGAANQEVG
jgi:uncharacterized membrane protein (DUF2068 family)